MKKTYIFPAMLTVQLGTTTCMMQQSLTINTTGATIDHSEDILVKEQNTTDVNLWDNEW